MKDKKAAAILDKMPRDKAATILFTLTPKKISKIMAKMNPVNASEVTLLLKAGPPFDQNISK
jgi:flagellar motility protein MotE (MotC chaperone)